MNQPPSLAGIPLAGHISVPWEDMDDRQLESYQSVSSVSARDERADGGTSAARITYESETIAGESPGIHEGQSHSRPRRYRGSGHQFRRDARDTAEDGC